MDRNSGSDNSQEEIARKVMEKYRESFGYIDIDSTTSDEDWIATIRDLLELANEVKRE